MKRINLIVTLLFSAWMPMMGQEPAPADSVKNNAYIDSLFMELPEVMITGERPLVKAELGKLVYDLPRIVTNLPADNAYEAIKNLPSVVEINDGRHWEDKASLSLSTEKLRHYPWDNY